MKLYHAIAAGLLLFVAVGCTAVHSPAAATNTGTGQTVINQELEKVTLSVPRKTELTAAEVKQEHITATGYDTSYTITYEAIISNASKKQITVTFFLKKSGIESKKRSMLLAGFKEPSQAPSEQELINQEVDKVELSVPDAAQMIAEELSGHTDAIQAKNYASGLYTLHYKVIKPDTAEKTAAITFFLTKNSSSVQSKDRTLTVRGFKAKVIQPEYADIAERELLTLFELTENKIPASAAAKKIAGNGTFGSVQFTGNQVVSYDDGKGVFTVSVSGTKGDKPFSKKLTISGFTNPYAAAPLSVYPYQLKYDEAIQGNKALTTHIQTINAATAAAFNGKFSMQLENGMDVQLGEYEHYSLTVSFENRDGKVRIKPKLCTKNHIKLESGAAEEPVTTVDNPHGFTRFTDQLTQPYFTEKDVLEHILKTVKDDTSFVTADSNSFASHYYAQAKVLKTTPAGLFNADKLKPYTDVYETKGSGHLEIKGLGAFIYSVASDSITADDYAGSLTLTYCISSNAAAASGFPLTQSSTLHTVTTSGFKKIDDAAAKSIFSFTLVKNGEFSSGAHKDAWLKKTTLMNGTPDVWLLRETGTPGDHNWLQLNSNYHLLQSNKNPYYLVLNGDINAIKNDLARHSYSWLSKGCNNEQLLIRRITLQKEWNKEELTIKITFCGRDNPIEWSIKPNIY